MIKMLFSDLDGTLLYSGGSPTKEVNEENKLAIARLHQHQIRFGIATGRSLDFLPTCFDPQMNYDTVAMCGALIRVQGKLIERCDFNREEVEEIMDIFFEGKYDQRRLRAINLGNDHIFPDPTAPEVRDFIANPRGYKQDYRHVSPLSLKEYIQDPDHDHIVCFFGHFESSDALQYYKEMMRQRFGDHYSIIQSSPQSVNLAKKGINKGTGIFKAAAKLNLRIDEIACVGDSENDIEMFQLLPHSFCMSHSPADIRSQARYTISSVAECIDQILRMNKEEILRDENIM